MSSTAHMAVFERECCETTATAIRKRLTYARCAGLLESYDDDATYVDGKLVVMLLRNRMHPSRVADFGCEKLVAERVINVGMSLHRASEPPRKP